MSLCELDEKNRTGSCVRVGSVEGREGCPGRKDSHNLPPGVHRSTGGGGGGGDHTQTELKRNWQTQEEGEKDTEKDAKTEARVKDR